MSDVSPKCTWPAILLALFLLETLLLGLHPYSRTVWLAEGLTAWIPALLLIVLYRRGLRFSNLTYTCVALWFFLHTIGGHYTFERVPMQWLGDMLGWQRNHFDRICHFLVGTMACPLLEYLSIRQRVRGRLTAAVLVVLSIFGVAAIFELVEWQYAVWSAPEAGAAFLGSQGDIWDAQKDMLADGLGAMTFSLIYLLSKKNAFPPAD
ncbi:MAG: DUF2238 domain-containing protein [Lentisphaeria bacterium]|nr:DUF2238 domain-containing protein [Lentisphaeria bacterium]